MQTPYTAMVLAMDPWAKMSCSFNYLNLMGREEISSILTLPITISGGNNFHKLLKGVLGRDNL